MTFSMSKNRQQMLNRLLPLLAMLLFSPLRPSCGQADEFQCEEASQYIYNCCGKYSSVNCINKKEITTTSIASDGCDSKATRTQTTIIQVDMNISLSACILGRTCEEIVASGACSVSSWQLPSSCTTKQGACQTYDTGVFEHRTTTSCDEIVTCSAPSQSRPCTSASRPQVACDALQKLSCE